MITRYHRKRTLSDKACMLSLLPWYIYFECLQPRMTPHFSERGFSVAGRDTDIECSSRIHPITWHNIIETCLSLFVNQHAPWLSICTIVLTHFVSLSSFTTLCSEFCDAQFGYRLGSKTLCRAYLCITGCAVAQHCCNDDQQSQWEIGDFDPL